MAISVALFLFHMTRQIVAAVSVLSLPWFQISVMMFILGFLAIL